MQFTPIPGGPAMLIVGHPGHELRVHGWLERARPMVLALTDGSGHSGVSRLGSTASLIDRAGAVPGPVFGRFSDAALNRLLLDGNLSVLIDLSDEISNLLIEQRTSIVVGDDAEGYDPAHDVCRILINAAVNRARDMVTRPIANLAFSLGGNPDQFVNTDRGSACQVLLDDAALKRKIDEASRYPAAEGEPARKQSGDALFRVETFRHVPAGDLWEPVDDVPFGEQIQPLADALASRPLRRAS